MKLPKGVAPALLIAIVVLLWIGCYFVVTRSFPEAQWGIIGDLFGAVNALFSGLAFAGVVWTLYLQQKDSEEQQRAANATANAMLEQSRLMAKQVEALQGQLELQQRAFQEQSIPRLVPVDWTGNPGTKNFRLSNKGGRFRIYQHAWEGKVKVEYPVHWIASNETVTITVHQERPLENEHQPNDFAVLLYTESAVGKLIHRLRFAPASRNFEEVETRPVS